ncbi:hypothetical protein WICPIJ_007529 [Wickerhamomyces pijperi]|uniref:Uncharacterized protein n=1 Tax=Wickerhamomyces pijperi TaxID=599730 RepID=A0A9P8PZZ7_WICPI|nr:hypothetical protein WICPIJ_007529 [Wickerhamomyces pijperi]
MDNISNLSNNLPPTKPVNEQTIKELDLELNQEFRDAANAVASLYKLSIQKKTIIKHQGYLDCINDLLNVIKNDGDVESWALGKRAELTGDSDSSPSSSFNSQRTQDLTKNDPAYYTNHPITDHIPADSKFTISHPTDHRFRPTMPLLSVDYTGNKQAQLKRSQTVTYVNSAESDLPLYDISQYANDSMDNEVTSIIVSDHSSVKRSIMEGDEPEKRQKLDNN